MAGIKSALELALERTKDIASDKSGLESKEAKELGMKMVAQLEKEKDFDLKKELKSLNNSKLASAKRGIFDVILSHIQLPLMPQNMPQFDLIEKGLKAVMDNGEQVSYIRKQLEQFLGKYSEDLERLDQGLREQYAPILKQKEAQIAQQTGQQVNLQPESDPEFQKLYQKNIEKLKQQYNDVIQNVKGELKTLFEEA